MEYKTFKEFEYTLLSGNFLYENELEDDNIKIETIFSFEPPITSSDSRTINNLYCKNDNLVAVCCMIEEVDAFGNWQDAFNVDDEPDIYKTIYTIINFTYPDCKIPWLKLQNKLHELIKDNHEQFKDSYWSYKYFNLKELYNVLIND